MKTAKGILLYLAVVALIYAIPTFYYLTLDFTLWHKGVRAIAVLLWAIITFFCLMEPWRVFGPEPGTEEADETEEETA